MMLLSLRCMPIRSPGAQQSSGNIFLSIVAACAQYTARQPIKDQLSLGRSIRQCWLLLASIVPYSCHPLRLQRKMQISTSTRISGTYGPCSCQQLHLRRPIALPLTSCTSAASPFHLHHSVSTRRAISGLEFTRGTLHAHLASTKRCILAAASKRRSVAAREARMREEV